MLDADLAAAFDRIDHDHLLASSARSPPGDDRGLAEGRCDREGSVHPDRGGNSARRGYQPAAAERCPARNGTGRRGPLPQAGNHAGETAPGCPVLIRYADDLVALCHTREQAEQVKARLAGWLAPRGLAFNEDKTRIVTLDEGFDFLGFTVRRLPRQAADQTEQSGAETDPGTAARRGACPARGERRRRCSSRLNPIIRGWAAYYRTVVSSKAFATLDTTCGGSPTSGPSTGHPKKPRNWIVNRYFGAFNKSRQDRWVFGDRDSGAYLDQVRLDKDRPTPMVKGRRPRTIRPWPNTGPTGDDEGHTPQTPHSGNSGLAPCCRRYANRACATGRATGRARPATSVSTTPYVGGGLTPSPHRPSGFCMPASLQGLLEPDARKRACPVLRGAASALTRPAYPTKAAFFASRPWSTTRPISGCCAAWGMCSNCKPRPVTSTAECWIMNMSVRAASLRVGFMPLGSKALILRYVDDRHLIAKENPQA